MAIKVFKFGGALLNKSDGFKQLKTIIDANYNAENKLILIISAFEKTTAKLLEVAVTAETTSGSVALEMLKSIFDFHYNIAENIIKTDKKKQEIRQYIQQQYDTVSHYIRGISVTKELTPRTKDLVLSTGEMLASNIVSAFLSEHFDKVVTFNVTNVLITDSVFGAATPNLEKTKNNIRTTLMPTLEHSNIVVTQGFIATTDAGEITTMGYESSNLSATILAGLTNANEFVIWTDTAGIRQFDPKKVRETTPKLISNINYKTAEFFANSGLKLIYPNMIKHLQYFNIEVKFKSGYLPEGEYTTISNNNDDDDMKLIVTSDKLRSYSCCGKALQPLFTKELIEQNNIISLTLVNFAVVKCLQVLVALSPTWWSEIKNVIVDNSKQITKILLENNSELENMLIESFVAII